MQETGKEHGYTIFKTVKPHDMEIFGRKAFATMREDFEIQFVYKFLV